MESPTSLPATASFGERHSGRFIDWYLIRGPPESVTPATSYTNRTDGHWPSYDRAVNYRQTQSYQSGNWNPDASFASTAASEGSTAVYTPSSGEYPLEELGAHRSHTVPLNYQGANQSGASTSTSSVVPPLRNPADTCRQGNADTSRWSRTVPDRARMTQTEWHQPYGVSRTRPNWHGNAEAGPSTLLTPPVPYISQPTTRPSGGISKTVADTINQSITEEHRASVSNFYCSHIPHATEWLFSVGCPSGPRFPMAKETHDPPMHWPRGCVTGYGGGVRNLQRSTRLWLVSRHPV